MLGTPISTYLFLFEDTSVPITEIPSWYNLIRFDTANTLYLCPMQVLPDKTYGCQGGTRSNPLGKLENRFNWAVENARKQNPDIKIVLMTMMDENASYEILSSPTDQETYTDSVREFMAAWDNKTFPGGVFGRIDGYDVDYEYGTNSNVQKWAPTILTQIREKLDRLSQTTGVKYQVSVTPDTADYLDDMATVLDLLNMQNYDGGAGMGPDQYLASIKNLRPSQLVWGLTLEQPVSRNNVASSLENAIELAGKTYKGSTEEGSLGGIMTWRINSDNWVYENMAQIVLYFSMHGIMIPTGLKKLVDDGWTMDGGRKDGKPVAPYLQQNWIDNNEWKVLTKDQAGRGGYAS